METALKSLGAVPEKCDTIIFVAEGGLGRIIASTAVVAQIKKTYPEKKIVVISGQPDVFLYNPHVYKTFNFQNPLYFYDDFVKETSFLMHVEPYRNHEYLHGKRHLLEIWCEMVGVPYENAQPEIYLLKREEEVARDFISECTKKGKFKFALLQWVGGIIPKDKSNASYIDSILRMHRRSLPKNVAQKLVNKLISRNYAVGAVQHENFPDLEDVTRVHGPIRNVMALLKYADAFIGIDSFCQHTAAAFNKPGVIVWGGTHPKSLGYDLHTNLVPEKLCPTPFCHRPNSYIFDANPSGYIWNCQYDDSCMDYDADTIIKALEDQKAAEKKAEPPASEVAPVPELVK